MWLATKHGFFSIVQKNRGEFHVRARVHEDLVALRLAARVKVEIEIYPSADYRYRLIVNHRQLAHIFAALENSIDYPNFKSEIAATPGQREKLPAYHEIWHTMAGLQG
jgi:hypothetical protein